MYKAWGRVSSSPGFAAWAAPLFLFRKVFFVYDKSDEALLSQLFEVGQEGDFGLFRVEFVGFAEVADHGLYRGATVAHLPDLGAEFVQDEGALFGDPEDFGEHPDFHAISPFEGDGHFAVFVFLPFQLVVAGRLGIEHGLPADVGLLFFEQQDRTLPI